MKKYEKVFPRNDKITHTRQTYLGTIEWRAAPKHPLNGKLPQYLLDGERIPVAARTPCMLPVQELLDLFVLCVLERRLPQFQGGNELDCCALRLSFNIHACCDRHIDIDFVKRKVAALDRLNLEQAAALVISAIRNDDEIDNREEVITTLIHEIDQTLLTHGCMWLEEHQRASEDTVCDPKFAKVVWLLEREYYKNKKYKVLNDGHPIKDWSALLPALLRVRRCRPRNRCLFIPEWIFEAAKMEVPSGFEIWDKSGKIMPGHEPLAASGSRSEIEIILSRKLFRVVQRTILHYHRFWDPAIRLRKGVADLEANDMYGTDRIKPIENTLVVAHYFFALQRCLQRKKVSHLQWTEFVAKGDSGNKMLNNINNPTSFEQRLIDFSGETGVPLTGPVWPQIDQWQLLMADYVSVCVKREKKTVGGVDFSLLCDLLKRLGGTAKTRSTNRLERMLSRMNEIRLGKFG